jgi:CheY-like chemotaxis protein/predicted DNA-binding transcriptional regulator
MVNSPDEDLTLSRDFIQQVRDLLEHLYDFPFLQKQVLVLPLSETARPPLEIPGQKARKFILDALEKIGVEKDLSFRSSKARIYNLLRLHYIEGMAIQQVAQELDLSQRQAYRDLRSGDERIASIVWENLANQQWIGETGGSAEAVPETAQLQTEPQFQPTDLNELVGAVCNTVRPLASQRSVSVDLHLPEHPAIIPTDAMIARQVITGLLSLAIQQALNGSLGVHLLPQDGDYLLRIIFQASGISEKMPDPSVNLYAHNLGWSLSQQVGADQVEIAVKINTRQQTCLVIDDHQGFIELLERYLADHALQIVAANNGPKGIELAQQLQPKVILLDVMVPEMDGWQILQRLHSTPTTRSIPVIICSVFYDPDLAFTLGAVNVLKKPVRKEDLVAALKKIGIL